jgi:hypothetical protein
MVMQHHETPDGEGYPYGLVSGEICQGHASWRWWMHSRR